MPPSDDEIAQRRRILGKLNYELNRCVRWADLRSLGWPDFFGTDAWNEEYAQAGDALTIAKQAFCYLCKDKDDNWNGNLDVIGAIVGLLKSELSRLPTIPQLERLKQRLAHRPIVDTEIDEWFDTVYLS
ncbi:MAG: hypothetical protein Q7T05_00590 [Dehalococcoidia bacterium]|nr:hypothetical protein [Dehalococcoidia bacterium]